MFIVDRCFVDRRFRTSFSSRNRLLNGLLFIFASSRSVGISVGFSFFLFRRLSSFRCAAYTQYGFIEIIFNSHRPVWSGIRDKTRDYYDPRSAPKRFKASICMRFGAQRVLSLSVDRYWCCCYRYRRRILEGHDSKKKVRFGSNRIKSNSSSSLHSRSRIDFLLLISFLLFFGFVRISNHF